MNIFVSQILRVGRRPAAGVAALLLAVLGVSAAQTPPSIPPRTGSGHIAPEQQHADKAPVNAQSENYAAMQWRRPGDPTPLPAAGTFANEAGSLTTLSLGGPVDTRNHPFFTPLGENGRACVSCHQPSDGMSVSVDTVRKLWEASGGNDPLFAAVDGSNCPHLPQEQAESHSLLLERGLFRIFRPWPPRAADGSQIEPQFTLEVVRDPTGCNTHPRYGLRSDEPMVSVYRRPRPVTNVRFLTAVGFPFEPKNGLPLPIDPETGQRMSGNLMADSRNGTLRIQAREAMATHLQSNRIDEAHVERIVEFENTLYSAQSHDRWGGSLTAHGADGGPQKLSQFPAGELQGGPQPVWKEFLPWTNLPPASADENAEQRAFRESVARGAKSFATRTFLIWDAAGITSMGFGNPVRNTCAFCHNMQRTGMDVAPGQVDLGTTNEPFADPAPDLPLFKLTCREGFRPHPHLGRVVYTQDPGYALTTGRCIDIGKITIQQMRALAARPPYFSNGSAQTIRDIVEFYDRRYNIGYTEQEKQDLVNLMSVL